jgi:hypothetical protein
VVKDRSLKKVRWVITTLAGAAVLAVAVVGVREWFNNFDVNARMMPKVSVSTPSSIAPLLVDSALGEMVFLNDVRIEDGPGTKVFFISGAQGRRMLVVSDDPDFTGHVGTVDIKGSIRRLPPVGSLRKDWRLTKEQAVTFGQQGIYLAAEDIKKQDSGNKPD